MNYTKIIISNWRNKNQRWTRKEIHKTINALHLKNNE